MRIFIFSSILLAACAGFGPDSEPKDEVINPTSAQGPTPAQRPTSTQGSASTPKTQAKPSETVPLVTPSAASSAELELRIAKLWARVDELENQQIRQKERMKLLEKGLMLGIIPDELKGGKAGSQDATEKKLQPEGEITPEPLPEKVPPSPAPLTEKSKDAAEYRRMLQVAQAKFNAANYGQAIVQYNEISEKFDDSLTEGSHHYWIGLGWFYLKEMQLSEQSFRKIIDQYNQNSWVPYARYYLAKIDLQRGLSGRARDQFKLLIDEYPNQDLGEMARMEIDRMREKL